MAEVSSDLSAEAKAATEACAWPASKLVSGCVDSAAGSGEATASRLPRQSENVSILFFMALHL
jgi:hypothetical protein